MYSRSTDRGGRRIKLPPGYDGNAFRHDTGEVRRLGGEPEMKIHSPVLSEENTEAVEEHSDHGFGGRAQRRRDTPGEKRQVLPGYWQEITEGGEIGTADTENCADQTESAEGEGRQAEAVPGGTLAVERKDAFRPEKGSGSLLEGLLGSLDSEDWLLFLVILLLVADGSDAWDLILLLGLLLAVK